MRTGRPIVPLVLTEPERHALEGLAERARTAPQVARRARIVLACARGLDNQTVAKTLRVSAQMVGRWRAWFVIRRADGLFDEPCPGVPRSITDAQVDAVITRTLETTPRGATEWSTRTMARASGLSPTTVHRVWRAFGLQPHRTETFTVSPDPLLVDTVRDIVGLSLDRTAHAVVFCVDEKPQIQALDRTALLLPMQPGQLERRTHTDKRHGTVSLLGALDVQTGEVLGHVRRRHRAVEFRTFLDALDAQVPPALDVHIIMDNYGDPHVGAHPSVVRQTAPLPCPRHADVRVVAEPHRALVRRARDRAAPTRCASQRAGPDGGHLRVHGRPQRRRAAVHLDEIRR